MKRILFLFGLLLTTMPSFSWHIVGGELEFITIEPGVYRINLIQYRDEAQGQNQTILDQYDVSIFSNMDDRLVAKYTLLRSIYEPIDYTKPECAIGELKTSRVIWTNVIEIDPKEYNDAEGYYLVWERCCRNEGVKNIVNPSRAGMKYVLEIPPLWKNGKPFVNSSPELLKPLSDYACINQLYYTNFTGQDRDGDSLVYRLATPLNSSSDAALPVPQPKPHFPIKYSDGFSLENSVPGSPPLSISRKGLLTVAPYDTGLYVFSVIVEEWRNGEQLGYVQRDFQMLVVDGCDPSDPPEVGVQVPGNDTFDPQVDILSYTLSDDKCFDFLITNITAGETISLRTEGVNFDGELGEDVFEFTSAFIGENQDTLKVNVCIPGCPPLRGKPFIVDFIIGDDACPLPQLDTARLTIEVEPPPNVFPTVNSLESVYSVGEDSEITIPLESTDADADFIVPILVVDGIEDPSEIGLFVEIITDEAGNLEANLKWETSCVDYDFSVNQYFEVALIMDDLDTCDVENPNVTYFDLALLLPPNSIPSVSLSLSDSISIVIGEQIVMDVKATDLDMNFIQLSMFNTIASSDARLPDQLGAEFEGGVGAGSASGVFTWDLSCDNLQIEEDADFKFYFGAEDNDRCEVQNQTSKEFIVHVIVPENAQPQLENRRDTAIAVNELFEIDITAFDPDLGDSLALEFFNGIRRPNSPSLRFEPAGGFGSVSSTLSWMPECDLLDFGQTSAYFDLAFLVYDNKCPQQKLDTMTFTIEVYEDREKFLGFEPPNVFTPNGDGKNDVYTLTNLSQPTYNLPSDNCQDTFQSISIFDRSGKIVFETSNREFIWDGVGATTGVYYYFIKYSKTEYKGYIHLLK